MLLRVAPNQVCLPLVQERFPKSKPTNSQHCSSSESKDCWMFE